jgi:glucuronate isomerase
MPLPADRFFDADPTQRTMAMQLYQSVAHLPLICPHGHVDPRLLADPEYSFGSPVDLFIIPDHYVFRMLYSQGISLEQLGISATPAAPTFSEKGQDARHRKAWQVFAEYFYLFRGTPTGIWLRHELVEVFGIEEALSRESADRIYDLIAGKLALPEFRPRALFKRFNIEVLCTTDTATDTLEPLAILRASGWRGRVRPTFRPDNVVNIEAPGWRENIARLSQVSGIEVHDFHSYRAALENRRWFFKQMGAAATDHGAFTPYTVELTPAEADVIFQRALKAEATSEDAARFSGQMLIEMARMSLEDGLVMQLHPGSFRNHNSWLYENYGADKGADIPVATEYTRSLRPLLQQYGNDPRLSLILFTLDESTCARELAPLAGHYPALKLGPPWWFYDSLNGMRRYFDLVIETAGLYNTAGFNDDTRAFCSIPARHDLWRRASCNWLAGLVIRHIIDEAEAFEMAADCAVGLARRAYRLGESTG